MKCDFSLRHYQELLKEAIRLGFKITNFRDYDRVKKTPKIILLRHDIDYSPQRALAMAELEHGLKLKSTYFVRVHGDYYHPFSRKDYPVFKKIIALGHEIGLHTEARSHEPVLMLPMLTIFRKEKEILEKILGLKIISAAEHADSIQNDDFWKNHFFGQVKKSQVKIKNFPQDKKFRELYYLSDSCQRWREGCLCTNLEKFPKIQVLVHADVWGKNAREEIEKIDPILFRPKRKAK